jgi:hypothetical protein
MKNSAIEVTETAGATAMAVMAETAVQSKKLCESSMPVEIPALESMLKPMLAVKLVLLVRNPYFRSSSSIVRVR